MFVLSSITYLVIRTKCDSYSDFYVVNMAINIETLDQFMVKKNISVFTDIYFGIE